MASFKVSGIDAEIRKFKAAAAVSSKASEAAVRAGAQLLAERLAEAAPVYSGARSDVTPGALRDSIRASAVKFSPEEGGYYSKVGPTGKDHGQALAMIGNVLEYGRSDGKSHRPWFNSTVAQAQDDVVQAMKAAFDAAVKEGL